MPKSIVAKRPKKAKTPPVAGRGAMTPYTGDYPPDAYRPLGTSPVTSGPRPLDAFYRTQFNGNPLLHFSPERLTRWVQDWDKGWIRYLWLFLQAIEELDDTLCLDIGKRKNAVAARASSFQIVDLRDKGNGAKPKKQPNDSEFEAQAKALEFYYRNLDVTSAGDLNICGGIQQLVYFVMDAVFKKYATFNIKDTVIRGQLSAKYIFVPGDFLENTHGRLRYTGPIPIIGQPIDKSDPMFYPDTYVDTDNESGRWLIAANPSWVGKALAKAYLFKDMALKDWGNLCARFGVPWVVGFINAPVGSPAFNSFERSLRQMGADGCIAVSKGANSTGDASVEVHSAPSGADDPCSRFVDRMDRKMTALCTGSDLSSMSRPGHSIGALVQGGQQDGMIESDCEWATAILRQQVDKKVLAKIFGDDVEPLAGILISPRSQKDVSNDIQVDTLLLQAGVNQSKDTLAARYDRINEDDVPEEDLAHAPTPTGQSAKEIDQQQSTQTLSASNDKPIHLNGNTMETLRAAANRDLAPIRAAMIAVAAAETPDQQSARIHELVRDFPGLKDRLQPNGIASVLEASAVEAMLRELDEQEGDK